VRRRNRAVTRRQPLSSRKAELVARVFCRSPEGRLVLVLCRASDERTVVSGRQRVRSSKESDSGAAVDPLGSFVWGEENAEERPRQRLALRLGRCP
jgi:hypothetical protein